VEPYVLEWLGLLVRWAHIVVGIAWIGASFYFVWLDDHLEPPKENPGRDGVAGELWAVHGGGFYRAEKFRLAPPQMPETLHWFKWEAYWTWFTGFALLMIVYYAGAELYLIDASRMAMTKWQAIGLGLGCLVAGLVAYEVLCRSPLGKSDAALAAVLFIVLCAAAWGLTQVFSGRGAFIHYGAILGTIMVANVAHVIIPGQRRMVQAMAAGRAPDPRDGQMGKQRSVHNTYFTLPVIFTMISSHYAFTFGSAWNWLVLVALTASGALIRVWFVLRHKGSAPSWPLALGLALLLLLAIFLSPREEKGAAVKLEDAQKIVEARCIACHAPKPTFPGIVETPKGILLDTPERIRAMATQIHQQAVVARAMPPGNLTGMTEEERQLLGRWHASCCRLP